ncbi:hypothetical protein Cflav_PD3120 [Pedosphaera parvula Ellin514]|uniref:Uncharacterized protein n=1 Tax=Pedosphaera parvula (strain Ellin514) TaxID=320771 RepID=B9XJK0_PEDPL|nr:hypothetical protein Cflav_PD3120 [Pedosphaera parvula Ellin514]
MVRVVFLGLLVAYASGGKGTSSEGKYESRCPGCYAIEDGCWDGLDRGPLSWERFGTLVARGNQIRLTPDAA